MEISQGGSESMDVSSATLGTIVESQRNLKSIEAALKLEKVERKRWEQQYKELYYELHNTEGIEADQVIMKVKNDESSTKMELERKLDEKQKYIGALEERLTVMMSVKDKDDLAFNQRIRELNEQLLSLQKQSETENYIIKIGFELKLDEKQRIIRELEERLKTTKAPPIKMELEMMGSNESLYERLKAMRNQKKKDDLAFNQRIMELNDQVHALKTLNQKLIAKERRIYNKLQKTREALKKPKETKALPSTRPNTRLQARMSEAASSTQGAPNAETPVKKPRNRNLTETEVFKRLKERKRG